MHLVCPPIPIAARQRCGGACREELGDPWVAFFLSYFFEIYLWRKDIIKRAFDSELIQRSRNCTRFCKSSYTPSGLIITKPCLRPSKSRNQIPLLYTRSFSMVSNPVHNDLL